VKSAQPWQKFHHALSTKRELVPSHPVTAAAVVCARMRQGEIIRAVAVAAVSDAAAGRRTRALQRGPVREALAAGVGAPPFRTSRLG
jgi:hypothetical protein